MDDTKKREKRRAEAPTDIRLILDEIQREQVPERLLRLAEELQGALSAERMNDAEEGEK